MTDLLSIGASGVNVYQRALSTVSNNIANLNTEGYSKQTTEISQNEPQAAGRGFIGTGAYFNRVARQYDSFLEQSLQRATSDLESQQANAEYTTRLLDFLGDDDIGLVSALNKFFSSAQQLTTDPASSAYRSTMLRSAEELATRVNSLAEQLDDLGNQAFSAIEAETRSLNALAVQLGSLNSQLLKKKSELDQPPALLDRRDQLLRDIAEFSGITTKVNSQGLVSVSLSGSTSKGLLVDGLTVRQLSAQRDVKDPDFVRYQLGGDGGVEPLTGISSGSIAGYSVFLGSALKQSKVSLNDLVRVFADEVNAIQTAGLDLNGEMGDELFVFEPNISIDQSSARGALTITSQSLEGPSPEFQDVALTWSDPTGQWSAVDPSTGQVVESDGNGRLVLSNVVLTIAGAPQDGDRVLVSASSSPARGLRVALETGAQIAAASLFRVTPDETNRGGAVSSVAFDADRGLSGLDPLLPSGQYGVAVNAPIGVVGPSQSEIVLELDSETGASLQLLTRDGRHLIGQADAADFDAMLSNSSFFETGSVYDSQYLNATSASAGSYKDYAVEYGAFKDSESITQLLPLAGFSFNEAAAIDFGGGALELTVHAPDTDTQLGFRQAAEPNTTLGQVSIVGTQIYLGNGAAAEQIASIDYPFGALSSGPARVRVNFVDEQFENASFEADAVGATDITGWTVLNQQIKLGQDSIEGVLTPLDPTYPLQNTNTDLDVVQTLGQLTGTVVAGGSDGTGNALRLQSTGQTSSQPYAVVRGPALVSDTVAAVAAGDQISFDWKATGSGDAFDAFGYFINESTGETHIVLNQTGAEGESTDWSTIDFTVPESGDYRFVFISGSYDASGGRALGGELLVDNIEITRNNSSRLNPAVVDQIAQQLLVSDSRNLVGAGSPLQGDVIIEAYDRTGQARLSADRALDSLALIQAGNIDRVETVEAAVIRSDRIAYQTFNDNDVAIEAGAFSINGEALGSLVFDGAAAGRFGALSALDIADWIEAAGAPGVEVETGNLIRIEADQLDLDDGPGLQINGYPIASLSEGSLTTFSDITDLMYSINAELANTGVEAAIDGMGALLLRNHDGLGANIKLEALTGDATNALGRGNGVVTGQYVIRQQTDAGNTLLLALEDGSTPADLAELGLTTQVRIRGSIDEEIGIFLTGAGQGTVSLESEPSTVGFADGTRSRVYEVVITDDLDLEIIDMTTDTVVAKRPYSGETEILYQGISIQLRAPAEAGDRFVIDGNNTGAGQAFDAQGNNQNLLRIVDLERTEIVKGLSITDAYLSIVGDAGNQATQAEISVEALTILKDQAIEARDRVSGVSLDQEAADLIRFQQAYQASAQVMQVASRLFDAILQVR